VVVIIYFIGFRGFVVVFVVSLYWCLGLAFWINQQADLHP